MNQEKRPPDEPVTSSAEERCLLTGATGFIGGHLAQRLAQDGFSVRCLVRATSDTSLLQSLGVELAVGDITDPVSLARAASGCTHVLHCAALVSDWATVKEIARINVAGTRNLLEASIAAGAQRFIHFSTTDVYGYPGLPVDETFASTRFRNWYSQTKREAEAEVRRAHNAQALDAVILRPATVYGPRSTDVVGQIARAIRNRSMITVNGGRAVAGLCYVQNLVDAGLLALEHPAAAGQAFNVTDGVPTTWRQFVDDLAAGLGCPPVRWSLPYWLAYGLALGLEQAYRLTRRATGLTVPPLLSRQAVHVMGKDQGFSNHKIRDALGWEPRVDYLAGLEATVHWVDALLGSPGA